MWSKRLVTIAGLCILAALAWHISLPGPNFYNYMRVRDGMTYEEVDALLYRNGVEEFGGWSGINHPCAVFGRAWTWQDGIVVLFDREGRVVAKGWYYASRDQTLWKTVRRWLRL